MSSRVPVHFGRLLLTWLLGGCGHGVNAGEAVRPDAPTASDVMADTVACTGAQSYAEPLVVDWSTSSRTDLEVAMQQGVAVVRYDCNELRLINGCHLPAGYVFAGVSLKEELIRMDNADEIQANLPVSGVRISAGMDSAATLDLALVMIGKRTTTLGEADLSMLEGSCDGATHFVRAASIGAFAMDRSSKGQVRAAADLFGAGVGASSRSGRSNVTRDGDRKACKSGQPTDETAPAGCQAALRLELVPLKPARKAKRTAGATDKPSPKPRPKAGGVSILGAKDCPVTTVWKQNKCVRASAEERLCFRGNLPACKDLCDSGDGWACTWAAKHHLQRMPDKPKKIDPRALEAFNRGCKLRYEDACALGAYYRLLIPAGTDLTKVAEPVEASCRRGGAISCGVAALIYEPDSTLRRRHEVSAPAASLATYVDLMQRGCDLGRSSTCKVLARDLLRLGRERARAIALLKRTCEGGDEMSCVDWAEELDKAGDPATAAHARALSCLHGRTGWSCEQAATAFISSSDVPRDPDRANRIARRGCDLGDNGSCAFLVEHGGAEDRSYALQQSCDPTSARWLSGPLCREAANDTLKRAMELDRDACKKGVAEACERHATRQLAQACASTGSSSDECASLKARDASTYRQVVERQCRENRRALREGRLTIPDTGPTKGAIPWCDEAEKEGLTRSAQP